MKKWSTLANSLTPDGRSLSLTEHDGDYVIRIDGAELMSTRRHESEEELARLTCAHAAIMPGAQLLIGGLGFGFTLRAALEVLAADAAVVVAELLPDVIAWNKDPNPAGIVADSRVTIIQQDVAELICESREAFECIILDVDNGPDALTAENNQRLYSLDGLRQARAALRPGGCVGYWSAAPTPAFQNLMERAGLATEYRRVSAHGKSGRRHALYLGRVR